MSQFISHTMSDIRGGRQSWRVLVTCAATSFVIAVAAALLRVS